MTFGTDDFDEGLLDSIHVAKLLDNVHLGEQLIPAILELVEVRTAKRS
jgi:hypothetical protein